jgi:uncharacterized protein (TIGR00255 family)
LPFSMTGFGAAEGDVAGGRLRVEIRTVNHRYFNPAFKLPSELAPLEADLRERLRRDFGRGHVAVTMRWVDGARPAGMLQLNVPRAREAMARLRELQTAVGLTGEVSLDLLARQLDVLTIAEPETQTIRWDEVDPLVADAAADCRAMRRREGDTLAGELRQRLEELAGLALGVERRAPARVELELERLRDAVGRLLEGRSLDDARLAQEIALLADRLDVTEELVRLRAHLAAALGALAREGSVGKELGFLAQELGREINTIGAKANDAEITRVVIAMKGALEKFREQVENLE